MPPAQDADAAVRSALAPLLAPERRGSPRIFVGRVPDDTEFRRGLDEWDFFALFQRISDLASTPAWRRRLVISDPVRVTCQCVQGSRLQVEPAPAAAWWTRAETSLGKARDLRLDTAFDIRVAPRRLFPSPEPGDLSGMFMHVQTRRSIRAPHAAPGWRVDFDDEAAHPPPSSGSPPLRTFHVTLTPDIDESDEAAAQGALPGAEPAIWLLRLLTDVAGDGRISLREYICSSRDAYERLHSYPDEAAAVAASLSASSPW